jgi:molybdate transport system substrate-binding protein
MSSDSSESLNCDAELIVLCAGGFRQALETILEECTSIFRREVRASFATPARLKETLLAGTRPDIVVAVDSTLAEVDTAGRIQRETRKTLARTRLALVLARGAESPNISSLANFSKYLNRISSLALSDPKAGTPLATRLIESAERCGIGSSILTRATFVQGSGSDVAMAVAAGKAEAGIALASEISTVAGVVNAGAIPADLQQTVSFDIFIPVDAPHPEFAREFRSFFDTRAATDIMKKCGMSTT